LNPDAGGTPEYKKTLTYVNTSAPDGKTLIFEGQDETQRLSWSGTLYTEEHFNAYVEWWQKRRQIQVTDDLGRSFWIYLVSFTPRRVRVSTRPWKHEYEVEAIIVDWA
jgi:hypothetical protein